MLSIGRWLDTVRASDAPACLQCSLSKGPVLRGVSGGARPVTLCVLHPLCVRVQCTPEASGAHLTASGGLKVTVRVQRARFKLVMCGYLLTIGHRVPASGGS